MESVSTKEDEEQAQTLQGKPENYSRRPLAPLSFKQSTQLCLLSFAKETRE